MQQGRGAGKPAAHALATQILATQILATQIYVGSAYG